MAFNVTLKTGDLRRVTKRLGISSKDLKTRTTAILTQEAEKTAKAFKKVLGAAATTNKTLRKRSGDLADSIGYDVYVSPYKVEAKVGQYLGDNLQVKKLRLHSTGMELQAKRAKKLAYPAETAPSDIRDPSTGEQKMTAREAAKHYFLVFTDYAIYGRKRTRTSRRPDRPKVRRKAVKGIDPERKTQASEVRFGERDNLKLLFIRRDSVKIQKRIDVAGILQKFKENVAKRFAKLGI